MRYVGVDLAWGDRNRTGLAVLDEAGRLLHVATSTTDEAIAGALAPHLDGPCLVAIDAPLVVGNATGSRRCEAELNRDFGRFHAGAHPSNTGRPWLAGVPRGARLAEVLDLDIDPRSRSARRAIEVYPHPATVALFRLGRTLKYKQRTGRSLEQLRAALLTLMGHLEGLAGSVPSLHLVQSPAWHALRAAAETAAGKAQLRQVEDQVDAALCAYVARFAQEAPERTRTYGDLASGYIVTPALPDDLVPEPRQVAAVPAGRALVHRAVQAYAALYPSLTAVTDRYVALVTNLLDDAGINYLSVDGRTKSVASFAGKAGQQVDGVPRFTDPLTQITDQVGVRVITYIQSDVEAVADLLADQLTVLDDRDLGLETARAGRFGYSSRHLLVSGAGRATTDEDVAELALRPASVQVRTVLQHAWAEFEHDIRYKGTVPAEHASDLDRRFTLAAGLLELADREFSMIRDRLQQSMGHQPAEQDPTDPRISAQELASFLSRNFADAGWSRTDHYAWISGLLLELGITSLEELGGLLTSVDSAAISERMAYKYPPGAVRRLDDALLAIFGERYVQLTGNAHRVDALRARLERLRG